MLREVVILLSTCLVLVTSLIQLKTPIPEKTSFTVSIDPDFVVRDHEFGKPAQQMKVCDGRTDGVLCYEDSGTRKEIVIFAQDIKAEYKTLKMFQLDGVVKTYTLGPDVSTTTHIQVVNNKINGVAVQISDYILRVVIEAVPILPNIKVSLTDSCDISGSSNCIQRFEPTPGNWALRLRIEKVNAGYSTVLCEGDTGYEQYMIHDSAPGGLYFQRTEDRIEHENFPYDGMAYEKCTVELSEGHPEIVLVNQNMCDATSPGCYKYTSGVGRITFKSSGLSEATVLRLQGTENEVYQNTYVPTSC